MNNIDISVVIPVKNGQRYLDLLLEAVFSQEINAKFEVVIIDSGSCDKTLDIIRQYPVRFYQIDEAEFNHGFTRNLGISKTQGRYIVLMTQDAIPYNNQWMKELVGSLECDSSVAGVYSRHIPHKDSCAITQIIASRFFTSGSKRRESRIDKIENYNKLPPQKKYSFCNFDNVSSCIRKNVWEKIPFPETDFAEDLQWSKRVLEAGYAIVYNPDSIVYHSHDFSISDWYNRNRVNSKKLYSIFGINTIDNFFKIILFSILYVARGTYLLFRDRRQLEFILSSLCLIPFFSVSGVLGQYKGVKDYKRS